MKSGDTVPLGEFRFDPDGPVLRDGEMKVVPLRSQTLKVLARLCQEPGEVVEKSTLFDDIWPDTHVTDASLVQCIREIRNVLQDGDFDLIRTFPRLGYMVVPSKEPGAPGHAPTRLPTLAVLPFAGEENAECKLSDALTAALAKYPVLSVISRVTVAVLSEQSMTGRQIAAETDADYILSGRVQRSDSQMLISAELIDTEHDRVVWTETFDETDGSQDDICGKIATTVGYMAIYHSPLAPKSGTGNAVRLQLAARIEKDKQTDAGIDRAEELNRMAVEADPTRPEGYLGLAFTFHQKFELGLGLEEPEEVLRLADEFASHPATQACSLRAGRCIFRRAD